VPPERSQERALEEINRHLVYGKTLRIWYNYLEVKHIEYMISKEIYKVMYFIGNANSYIKAPAKMSSVTNIRCTKAKRP